MNIDVFDLLLDTYPALSVLDRPLLLASGRSFGVNVPVFTYVLIRATGHFPLNTPIALHLLGLYSLLRSESPFSFNVQLFSDGLRKRKVLDVHFNMKGYRIHVKVDAFTTL